MPHIFDRKKYVFVDVAKYFFHSERKSPKVVMARHRHWLYFCIGFLARKNDAKTKDVIFIGIIRMIYSMLCQTIKNISLPMSQIGPSPHLLWHNGTEGR